MHCVYVAVWCTYVWRAVIPILGTVSAYCLGLAEVKEYVRDSCRACCRSSMEEVCICNNYVQLISGCLSNRRTIKSKLTNQMQATEMSLSTVILIGQFFSFFLRWDRQPETNFMYVQLLNVGISDTVVT